LGQDLSASREVLIERLKRYPEGFVGAYVESRLSGMIYGHPIKDMKRTWSENSSREAFDPNGEVYYIVNLGVSENSQNKGLGSKLLEETKRLASQKGFSKIVLGSRNIDSNVSFYTKNGFSKIEVIEGYLPEDEESKGTGVLMEYPLNH
jgi:ribosomal protein S18 acetylase RimI-like enzyme